MRATTATAIENPALERTARGFVCALAVGLAALFSPPLALFALALLGARVLFAKREGASIDVLSLAGPVLAALCVFGFAGAGGAIGVLFLWRVVSDALWATRESNRLAHAAGRPGQTRFVEILPIWLTAAYALALVAYTSPHMVVGMPLDLPHLPREIVIGVAGLAALGLGDWLLRRAADWRLGELAPAPTAHLFAYHGLIIAAYGAAFDLSAGVCALIAWRLAQAAPGPILARRSA